MQQSKAVVPIIIHSSSQISSAAAANNSQLSNLQHSTSSSGSSSGGSGNSNSSSSSTNSSSSSGSNSSSANNVLKSQLQSTAPPSSLLNALSSGSSSATGSSSSGNVSSATSSSSHMSGDANSTLLKDDKNSTSPPPAKRHKCDPKDMVDVCVGTSVGTITEPDCLGPCEPGTSVTLEGIVWHETEGGVLVVNVTWRGKTYVGTLIDCTKHDWAPPRFCDSPTEELDSRTPKGRAKRNRGSALFPVNDLSNFTETRSSMHSKLRNGGTKGRGRTTTTAESSSSKTTTTSTTTTASTSSGTSTSVSSNTPSTSPVAFLPPRPEKRKSKDECPSPVNGGSGSTSGSTSGNVINTSSVNNANASGIVNNGNPGTQSVVNPMTGLNVQISTKKCKSSASPCAISPVLLECPEQDCSKKYKHANGLRYHQSHAHGSVSSMDEDSSQPPESPQRIAPPTTPSPLPTVQSTNLPTVAASSTVTTATSSPAPVATTPTGSTPPVAVSVAVTLNTSQNPIATATTTTSSSTTVNSSNSVPSPSLLMTVNVSTVSTPLPSSHSLLSTTPQALSATSPVTSQPTITTPAAAGGSITTGVAGQPQPHAIPGGSSTLLSSALSGNQNGSATPTSLSSQLQSGQVQPPSSVQQQSTSVPQASNNGVAANPSRIDPSAKTKPGVLRFGPLPGEVDHNARLTPIAQGVSNLPGTTGPPIPPGTLPGTPGRGSNIGVASGLLSIQPTTAGTPDGLNMKSQNCSKQKKNRKSPGPSEFDVAAANRAEDVQSPAYSDISDDSAPVVDATDLDKSKGPPLPDATKKPNEGVPGQLGPLSGYGMYPYYPAMPHQSPYYSSDHTGKPPGLGHSPLGPNTAVDYKSKEPPLDLMNKPNPHQQQPPPPPQPGQPPHPQQIPPGDSGPQQNKDCPSGPPAHGGTGKLMQHFYPYGYMPTGFSYNLDPNYGPVSMMSEEGKMSQQQQPQGQIKEERIKESSSPNEYAKMGPQMIPTKLIKSEPIAVKDIKTEGGHPMHPKDQPPPVQQQGQPPISAYSGMFQRHGLNVGPPQPPQPSPHMNREDDLRRLFNYSDQRRSSTSSNSSASNMNTKDEPPSPSQPPPGHPSQGHGPPMAQSSANVPQSAQQSKGSKNQPPPQSALKQQKDIKTEDKEMLKVKQEGQKPTMETQGPPPPPTSQYYPHSLYMSTGPFGFDPNHQMYRNMLVPAASYSAPPYHIQIPRYAPPEDLSRNTSTKALDLLQHHASQYYNSHKIHELREGALKSPTSNVKVSVSSPNLSQQSSQNPNMCIPPSNSSISSLQQQQQQAPPSSHPQQPQQPGASLQPSQVGGPNAGSGPGGSAGPGGPEMQKDPGGPNVLGPGPVAVGAPPPPQPGQPPSRSPPPQRHVHTHHHTHVGLGYPMFQSPYGVLSQQAAAAAVTVISPFQAGPPTK
ncbi:AAEL007376-PA [Aedes aegypti]|uniref:AAEL007376-PA n=1 Tax=Aedes aegypti TaxID=7159 RepID=Q172H6_AEDAE|nr:AAEL007376-PA [Aedes aegypti]